MVAHTNLPSDFFLYLLTPNNVTSFSIQFSQINFGLPAFLLPSGFSRNTFFTVLPSDLLINDQPIQYSYFSCCYNTWFSTHNLQFIISSDSLAILIFHWTLHLT